MDYRKSSKLKKILVLAIVIIFGLTILFGAALPFFSSRDNIEANIEVPDKKINLKQDEQLPAGQAKNTANDVKYMTKSFENNIEIYVNYMNPLNGEKDTLTFDIIIDTHSVDLSKYEDLGKYLELKTGDGVVVNNGFKWNVENADGHHISGNLKIENTTAGKPIIGPDTKSFKLVFKNIGGTGEREHVYELDKLNS